MFDFARRRDNLRRLLHEKSLPALLVTAEINVAYLTGFTGDSSYLLITPEQELMITDGRYTQQMTEECPGLELAVRGPGKKLPDFAAEVVAKLGLPSLAIEADHVMVSFYERLKESLKSSTLVNASNVVESLREIKDFDEIASIGCAVATAQAAFMRTRQLIKVGRTEKEVADELEYEMRALGATCGAFPSIVGVGPRGALPHGRPTRESRIGDADFVLFDWGAKEDGYHSDLTRVLVTGKLSPQLEQIYGLVLRAQRAAIAAVRPGAIMQDVDAAARQVIEAAGHRATFNHALGHGIGLAIHELPRLAPGEKRPLGAGMVVTVEPGIYIADWGGVRIEDDVLVTPDGCEVLTSVPKELSDCLVSN